MNMPDLIELKGNIQRWGEQLGFQQIGIADTDLRREEAQLRDWLEQGYHADMTWMAAHGHKRSRPQELEPGTLRVISARMDYLPKGTHPVEQLKQADQAYISRYALGRDYHKLIRKRLATLASRIRDAVADTELARAFVDSAPVMEKPLAAKAGLGWQGKHTLLIHPRAGSWFFLGEIYTDLPLPVDTPIEDRCGKCRACMTVCPTDAIVAPYQLDARRCISYLTIEHNGPIPEHLRKGIGNRIFGCDDCQLMCPWNRYAAPSGERDFQPRHGLHNSDLISLFMWDEDTFLARTAGSAIRRAGYSKWLQNIAIALGNGPASEAAINALKDRLSRPDDVLREHCRWALAQLQ